MMSAFLHFQYTLNRLYERGQTDPPQKKLQEIPIVTNITLFSCTCLITQFLQKDQFY